MMVRQQEGGRKGRAKEMVSTIEEYLCVTPAFSTSNAIVVRGIAGGLLFAKGNDRKKISDEAIEKAALREVPEKPRCWATIRS